MKKYKYLSYVFAALAVLLSDVMCATVAYHYCSMQWMARYEAYGVPANAAFVFVLPYAIGVAICSLLSRTFYKRDRGMM